MDVWLLGPRAQHQRADTEVANAQRAARAGQRNASLPAEEEERAARRAAAQRAAEADGESAHPHQSAQLWPAQRSAAAST